MKRSQMIDIIQQGALDYNPTAPVDYHQASCILEAMERAGMTPPPYTKVETIFLPCAGGEPPTEHDIKTRIYDWEQ